MDRTATEFAPAGEGVSLVLPSGTPFAEVDRLLVAAGFVLAGTTRFGDAPTPDRARWARGGKELLYFRDPATGLASIVAPEGVELPLPAMDAREAGRLIADADPRTVLAGLQAAATLREPALAPAVAARLLDPDRTVAEHAATALQEIAAAAASGLVSLGDALFALPGWRREKLQVMRWLGRDGPASDESEGLLARALGDADWEIRVTVMLAAARLGFDRLARPIAGLDLPGLPADGVTARESRLLRALRDAALARLGEPFDRRLPAGVEAAIGGNVDGLPPGLAAFVHALAHPLPDAIPPPPEAPGVTWVADGPRLADGHLLAWVPPLPHWLGEVEIRGAPANPPRRIAPASGFFIDAEPRGSGSLGEARAAAAALARKLGRPVSLPSAEAWEMAARGPDGRRFPWGLNARPEARVDLSPWNVAGIASGSGEWVVSGEDGAGLVAGGGDNLVAARMMRRSAEDIAKFRFIYPQS